MGKGFTGDRRRYRCHCFSDIKFRPRAVLSIEAADCFVSIMMNDLASFRLKSVLYGSVPAGRADIRFTEGGMLSITGVPPHNLENLQFLN